MLGCNMAGPSYYIGLPPSNPRLLVPLATLRVQSCSFSLYSPGSGYGKFIKWLGKTTARIGLMGMLGRFVAAPVEKFKVMRTIQPILTAEGVADLRNVWEKSMDERPVSIAFSLGTPNHYRKVTALIFDRNSKPLAFAKVGCTPQAVALISNERRALKKLHLRNVGNISVPVVLAHGKTGLSVWFLQSPLLGGRLSPSSLQKDHIDFLTKLARDTGQVMSLASWDIWSFLHEVLNKPIPPIKEEFVSDRRLILNLCNRFLTLDSEESRELFPFAAAHGDFAPWNIRMTSNGITLFDWEHFLPLAPAGWDIIHFIVRVEHLIKKKRLEEIWAAFEAGMYRDSLTAFEERAGLHIPNVQLLALLVILAIVFDVLPEWVCRENGLEDPSGS
jgi:hypothetical protein